MQIALISDLHLNRPEHADADENLADHLALLCTIYDQVVLVGDVLEMYAAPGNKLGFFQTLRRRWPATIHVIETNDKIRLVNGNHDDGCLSFFYGKKPANFLVIDGYAVLHGHQADRLFNARAAESVSEFFCRCAFRLESVLRTYNLTRWLIDRQRRQRLGADAQRRYAESFLAANAEIRGIIMGHTHIPLMEFFGSQIYLNTGTYQRRDVFLLDTATGAVDKL